MKSNFDFTKSFIKIQKQNESNFIKLTDNDRISKINENMKNLNKYNTEHQSNTDLKTRMDNLKKLNKN